MSTAATEGRPDAIDWNVITVGLLAAVRDLEGRVRQLEAAGGVAWRP